MLHNADALSLITGGVALDAESVSISSSTTSGGRRAGAGARQILGLAIPGMRASSRGASLEHNFMEEIPEQLRTPKVPQVSLKLFFLLKICLFQTLEIFLLCVNFSFHSFLMNEMSWSSLAMFELSGPAHASAMSFS